MESHYMRVLRPFMAQGPGQLTVPGGAMVFLFGDEDRDGMVNVIYDGQVLQDCSVPNNHILHNVMDETSW